MNQVATIELELFHFSINFRIKTSLVISKSMGKMTSSSKFFCLSQSETSDISVVSYLLVRFVASLVDDVDDSSIKKEGEEKRRKGKGIFLVNSGLFLVSRRLKTAFKE